MISVLQQNEPAHNKHTVVNTNIILHRKHTFIDFIRQRGMLTCPMYFYEYILKHFTNSTVIPAVIHISGPHNKEDLGEEFVFVLRVNVSIY